MLFYLKNDNNKTMKLSNYQKDFYAGQAKKENYPARSVYKLKEINEKFHLVKKSDWVLDLGAAPGSWLLYLAECIGGKGQVIGIDINEFKIPTKANIIFLRKDVFAKDLLTLPALQKKFQAVVSDLAPKTSGIKFQDSKNSLLLCQQAWQIAKRVLNPGGNFLCKIFEGGDSQCFLDDLKKNFRSVQRFKPKASRKESSEFYIIAQGFTTNAVNVILSPRPSRRRRIPCYPY